MDKIVYFKVQAKNLIRDFKTQTIDEEGLTQYSPRFFSDIDDILLSYNIDEENFTLMNAQHLIAKLAGFKNWSELIHADDDALALGKLLLDKRNDDRSACMGMPLADSWEMYLWMYRLQNLPNKDKLAIFKAVYLDEHSNKDEEYLNRFDAHHKYEDYGYSKELSDQFRALDALTDELESL